MDDNLTVNSNDDSQKRNALAPKQENIVLKPKKHFPLSWNGCNKVEPNNCSLIVFDFETSGLRVGQAEILQIAAVYEEKEFNKYVHPIRPINPMASGVNHLKLIDNVLYYYEEPVDSVALMEAVTSFLSWIESVPPPRILVGHNVKVFDCPFLMNALNECNVIPQFCSLVIGFIDTLKLSRKLWPGLKNYKQNTLVQAILHIGYEEHNAIEDVRSLKKLISSVTVSDSLYLDCSFTSDSTWEYFQFNQLRKANMKSYDFMVDVKDIPLYVARKLASNNIFYKDISSAYKKGGKEELMALLGQKVDGKVIGTVNEKVIDGIIRHLEQFSK